jgi:ATP-dependent RNA helicase DeaD
MSIETVLRFAELGLAAPILQAIDEIGYETPSPIQALSIPIMLAGRDLLGQAQTGTGKTAAFALPILCRVDPKRRATQALVLTPTRELAIQVAEAFHSYGKHLGALHVLPIYGGQHISLQLRALQRGAHIVVGTPGRIIDHLERGTLKLGEIDTVVLDEADEMLRMGFIEDVDRILLETPESKQVALFSATLPAEVRRIATRHLRNPETVTIHSATTTVAAVRQRYLIAPWRQKLDAMTRILETTDFNAMLIFVRTKVATLELSEKLEARGHAVAALNGDMTQTLRERTVQRLRDGSLDIVVATDVAARGLDVSRISHVVNYDIPIDAETYVHRIGRTGRAGREGEALLLVQPREKRMLTTIERATGQKIEPMQLPSTLAVTDRRVALFKQSVNDTIESQDLSFFDSVLSSLCSEHDHSIETIAAALAYLVQQERPLRAPVSTFEQSEFSNARDQRDDRRSEPRGERFTGGKRAPMGPPQDGMERYRLEVGQDHGAQPKHIVGAITNESGLSGQDIGRIEVCDSYSLVDLPAGMPKPIFRLLQSVKIFGRPLRISLARDGKPQSFENGSNGGPSIGGHYPKATKPFKAGKPKSDKFAKAGKPGKPYKAGKGKPKKSKARRD